MDKIQKMCLIIEHIIIYAMETWYFILGQAVVQCVDESAQRGLERSVMFNVKFDVSCGMRTFKRICDQRAREREKFQKQMG